ncbi:acetyl-CoA acetyltransferase [Denitromonas ohlonensis]|uniref:Acetyl-CoA acetyltransferase n=3 Tax=Denitromonas TaxID=139331 RepID=A0A557SGL9_9RHOO|nr:acetyl-CoA acetyltransferase [Denitromonas ohlonensis]TVO76558.1 acetyl-CoA acetyltransferase [Denitromonas ohlonensis]
MQAAMVGWAHTRFGRLDDETLESLVLRVTTEALADAGVPADEVDSIHIGNLGGFDAQSFPAALPLQAAPGLRFKPATRYENACASGSAALHGALDRIAAGRSGVALVIGVEKMNALTTPEVARVLAGCSYQPEEGQLSFPGIFAQMAQAYFDRYGEQLDALAHIAAKNHANGALNPYAHIRKDLGFDYCRHESERNRIVAPPLKVSDCSTVADGAAAMIVVAPERIGDFQKAVGFRATAQVTDYLPMSMRDVIAFEGPRRAFAQAMTAAGTCLDDLAFAEVHDCFTIAELLSYEAMGLAQQGEGARVILDGISRRDGRLPINPSGGLKAKGHPVGATGVSMHVMSAMQLTGAAGDIQVPDARLGAVFNMGGSAVASYVSILEAIK